MAQIVNASVKISQDLHSRIKNLADVRHHTAHAIMLQAIESYVEKEEKHERLLSNENLENLTREELSKKAQQAVLSGNDKLAEKCSKLIPLPLNICLFCRDDLGKEFVENSGFNFSEAEEKYGKDWINKSGKKKN